MNALQSGLVRRRAVDLTRLPRLLVEPSMAMILEVVAVEFGVTKLDLESARRDAPTVRARWVAIWLARYMTELHLIEIGRNIGNRDYYTVYHALNRMRVILEEDPTLRQQVRLLEDALARARFDAVPA